MVTSARWTGLSPRVAVTRLSVFHCRLESNMSTCFIENSWKFRIYCPIYGEVSLPEITLSDACKLVYTNKLHLLLV